MENIEKLIYIICVHEAASALANLSSPGLIQGREHWEEIEGYMSNLRSFGTTLE
jgi:hypothetical protein